MRIDLDPDLLARIWRYAPCVVLGPAASEGPLAGGRVAIDTARAGVHEAGTALRMDDVPLPLRALLDGPAARSGRPAATLARWTSVRSTRAAGLTGMTDALRIVGGTVYDPAHGIDGEVRDVCIDDGRIVADRAGLGADGSTHADWS